MGFETVSERKSLQNVAKQIRCTKCGVINSKSKYFCDGCGYTLSKDAVFVFRINAKIILPDKMVYFYGVCTNS